LNFEACGETSQVEVQSHIGGLEELFDEMAA